MATIPTTDSGLVLSSSALLRRTRRAASSVTARLPAVARRRPQLLVRASAKEIAFDQGSRAALQAGVEKLAAAVGVTLGPRGLFFPLHLLSCPCRAALFYFFFKKKRISLLCSLSERRISLLLRRPIHLRGRHTHWGFHSCSQFRTKDWANQLSKPLCIVYIMSEQGSFTGSFLLIHSIKQWTLCFVLFLSLSFTRSVHICIKLIVA
jgi:hypothetical protein